MTKWMGIIAALGVAVMLAVVPACGGSMSSTTTQPTATPDPVTVTIDILGNRFDPQELTVPAGSTVIFHNTTSAQHGIACDSVFDATVDPGQDYPHTFNSAGSYHVGTTTHAAGVDLYVDITVE